MGAVARESIINEIRRFELFTTAVGTGCAGQADLIIERSRLIPALAAMLDKLALHYRSIRVFWNRSQCARLRLEVDSGGKREEWHADSVVGADAPPAAWRALPAGPPLKRYPRSSHRAPAERLPPDTTRVWFVPMTRPTFTG